MFTVLFEKIIFSVQDKKIPGAVAQNGQLLLTATFLRDLSRPLWTGSTAVI